MLHRDDLRDVLSEAGALALRLGPEAPARKADGSWVTRADLEVSALLHDRLHALLPEARILDEEAGGTVGPGWTWAVDPIDGTTNFLGGDERWVVSIALLRAGRPVVGGIVQPTRDRMWLADPSGASFERPTTRPRAVGLSGRLPLQPRRLVRMARWTGTGALRISGSMALDLVDVAAGRLRHAVGMGTRLWDIAAGQVLVEAVGGRVERHAHGDRFDIRATGPR